MTPRRRAVIEIVGTAAVAAGTAWAVAHEWGFISPGLRIITDHTDFMWVVAAIAMECLSMAAFALLQGGLLRAAGSRLTLAWLLSTAYTANAISVSVPVIGSGMATAYDYRQLRSQQVDASVAKAVLTLAGVASTVSLAVVVAIAAILSGNPAGGLGGAASGIAAVAGIFVMPRLSGSPRLLRILLHLVRFTRRVLHRPRREPAQVVASILATLERMRVPPGRLALALTWGALNWLTDASCLVLAIKAIGVPVPWDSVLLVWSAGISAGSFSPTPDGIGVVEITMTAGLVAAGLKGPDAVAAVLLYRMVAFKGVITTCWFGQRAFSHWRHRPVAAA